MENHNINIETVKLTSGWRNILIAIGAAIPVFFIAYFYTDSTMETDDESTALIITIYFIGCVYAGRYISYLWVNKNGTVSKNVLIATGIIIAIAATLVFVMAQATLSTQQTFLRILFIGLPLTLLAFSSGIIIKLLRISVRHQLTEAKAAASQSEDELRFLQNQLSPHFLFNTLNNMYGISLIQHEKIPGLLLKLSDLLRYSVYDAKELFVPLKNELAYIKDYIDFEKIRIGDKLELHVSFEDVLDSSVKIAPLLLIVFIENAFKHSKNTTEEKIYISITLKTWANSILFSVKNSCGGNTGETGVLSNDSGFGLENVTKRLELLYNNDYDLKIENKDRYYHIMLQLKSK